jgi:hypothetical protein
MGTSQQHVQAAFQHLLAQPSLPNYTRYTTPTVPPPRAQLIAERVAAAKAQRPAASVEVTDTTGQGDHPPPPPPPPFGHSEDGTLSGPVSHHVGNLGEHLERAQDLVFEASTKHRRGRQQGQGVRAFMDSILKQVRSPYDW